MPVEDRAVDRAGFVRQDDDAVGHLDSVQRDVLDLSVALTMRPRGHAPRECLKH